MRARSVFDWWCQVAVLVQIVLLLFWGAGVCVQMSSTCTFSLCIAL